MYTLGGVTLPKPKKLTRNIIEKSVEHLLMFGRTTKKTQNRKEQFILEYKYLTQEQVNTIMAQYELGKVLTFVVNEVGLSIASTEVLMDITGRTYPPSGQLYRENLNIILTEVI